MTRQQTASGADQRLLCRKRHSSYTEKRAFDNKTECVYDVTFLFVIRFKPFYKCYFIAYWKPCKDL